MTSFANLTVSPASGTYATAYNFTVNLDQTPSPRANLALWLQDGANPFYFVGNVTQTTQARTYGPFFAAYLPYNTVFTIKANSSVTNSEIGYVSGSATGTFSYTTPGTTTTTTQSPPTITLTANTTSVVEGQAIRFTLTTTRLSAGNVFPYIITGVSSSDIESSPPLTGNIVLGDPNIPRKTNVGTGVDDWVYVPTRSIFQRNKFILVADEIYWNEYAPTGAALKAKVDNYRTEFPDSALGVVVTPYTFFPVVKASEETVLADVVSSGVDFVAVDPYYFKDAGLGWTPDALYRWTVSFRDKLLARKIRVFLVVQGFARSGSEIETEAYNQRLLSLADIEEFIIFGLEDGLDLVSAGNYWVSLNNDFPTMPTRSYLEFVINKDFIAEYTESFTLSLTGPGRSESVTVFVDDKIFVPTQFDQNFIRFFN